LATKRHKKERELEKADEKSFLAPFYC